MKQNSFILAAGVSLAMAFTFSCSSDGSDGADGKDGSQGLQGEQGSQGIQGVQGTQGNDGEGCSMKSITEGIEITCGSQVDTLKNGNNGTAGGQGIQGVPGEDGKNCEAEQDEDGIITITCGESTVGIAFCGESNKLYNPINQSCYNDKVYYLFTDSRDGKKYAYVEIGDYTWMVDNLVYGNEEGKYTWAEALEACPDDWELPTKDAVKDNETEILSILSDGSNDGWWTNNEYSTNSVYWYGYDNGYFYYDNVGSRSRTYFVRCVKAN